MYKRFVYTPVIIIITILKSAAPNEEVITDAAGVLEERNHGSEFSEVFEAWNRSSENPFPDTFPPEEISGRSEPAPSFYSEVSKCIEDHQYLITENINQGKHVILKCFKTTLMLNLLRYLGDPSKSSIKLFNGLLELKKIPERFSSECGEEYCDERHGRNFAMFEKKKNEYVRLYKKAMQKLINERKRLNSYRNQTQEEKTNQLNRINENSQAFLSEIIRNFGNENLEKAEEEKLKREVTDPRLLSVLDALSRSYMLRFRFYPGASARMMRSVDGGITFDLEIQDSEPETEEEVTSDESATREIKDGPQGKDIFEYDYEDDGGKRKRGKGDKKKKKEKKKKAKKLKKIIPYLLLPMIIQASLLPFVFKKLFFLAMKALFAGKVALILVGFNLLRNTCIKNDDDFQKIRVEHYGYRRGEEYGAWINGRSLEGPPGTIREPYLGHRPVTAKPAKNYVI